MTTPDTDRDARKATETTVTYACGSCDEWFEVPESVSEEAADWPEHHEIFCPKCGSCNTYCPDLRTEEDTSSEGQEPSQVD